MHCPVCSCLDTHVVDSRLSPDGTFIRRRRECEKCEYRFSTLEEIELLDMTVVKRNGTRESYSREKIERGLKRALEKRSYTESGFRALMHSVERDIQRVSPSEITSADIGRILMDRLKAFDKVAYIRFASVYRQFEDVETFQQELERLTKNVRPLRTKGKTKKKKH